MKNVIKTFQEDNGDIIDCFDIYNQPGLAHPRLKNHQVQLKPISKPIRAQNSKNMSLATSLKLSKCPNGYVPVLRTSNDDLSMTSPMLASESLKFYDARVSYKYRNLGAFGYINVWGVPVSSTQSSGASIWIQDGPPGQVNRIIAGWKVYPALFKDNKTRLFNYWDIAGPNSPYCYNTLCPGFVQVNSKIYLGAEIHPLSTYDGTQYEIEVQIYQDLKTGNWWLEMGDELFGYWPKTLFTYLQDGATYAAWGGHATSPPNEPSPPMGSGHKPRYKNTRKVAYVREMQLVNDDGALYGTKKGIFEYVNSDCYNAEYHIDDLDVWAKDDGWRSNVVFGGPGGCT